MQLEPRLKKIRDWAEKNLTPADNTVMEKHIEFLKSSGAVERALKVGQKAPDFNLKNQRGEMIALSGLLKNGPLVLSFYRGAWCPYCVEEVKVLNDLYPRFKEVGAEVAVISPQRFENTERQAEEIHLNFNVLVDKENQTGKAFGVVYTFPDDLAAVYSNTFKNSMPEKNDSKVWELPMPARFIIGRDGVVLSAKVDPDYRFRPEPSQTLEEIEKLSAR